MEESRILETFDNIKEICNNIDTVETINSTPHLRQEMILAWNIMANSINNHKDGGDGEERVPSMGSDAVGGCLEIKD